ncbi:MAG: hypothetical protein ACRDYW_10010 [Acidimicrobiales bacterium]
MATDAPRAAPEPSTSSGPGCLVLAIAFPVVILGGIVIGTVLNRSDEPEERSVTVEEGTIGGTGWRVDAVRDVEGDTCAFLFEDDVQLTGGCALTPDDATFGDQTVVFGKAATDTTSVRVELSDGQIVEVDTVEVDGVEGRWYVEVVDGDVDAVGLDS